MKIRILTSASPDYWYADHIGQEFEVHERINRHNEYDLVEEVGGSVYSVGADDCEVV